MPYRDRGNGFKVVTALAIVLIGSLAIVAIFDVGRLKGKSEGENIANSDTYARHAQEDIERRCLLLEPSRMTECIREVVEAYNESENAERDLVAQSDMALWALVMAVVTAATAGVTGVGVYYVRRTLIQADETNRAAVAAADAANEANRLVRDERRPWLVIEREVNCEFFDAGHGGKIVWNYEFVNKGKTRAYDYRLSTQFIRRDGLMYMDEQLNRYAASRIKAHRSRGGAILFPGESTRHRRYRGVHFSRYGDDGAFETGKHVMFMACLTYRLTHNGEKFGFDARMFEVEESRQYLGPFGHTILEYGSARVVG